VPTCSRRAGVSGESTPVRRPVIVVVKRPGSLLVTWGSPLSHNEIPLLAHSPQGGSSNDPWNIRLLNPDSRIARKVPHDVLSFCKSIDYTQDAVASPIRTGQALMDLGTLKSAGVLRQVTCGKLERRTVRRGAYGPLKVLRHRTTAADAWGKSATERAEPERRTVDSLTGGTMVRKRMPAMSRERMKSRSRSPGR
jgi:hypothetical protein